MKPIKTVQVKTVQDLIDELMLVPDKTASIHVVETDGEYDNVYTPGCYDFSIKSSDTESEYGEAVILEMYR